MVRNDFEQYARATLRHSLVTGLPQIVSAGSTFKKVVRVLVFLLCLAGFIYQSIRFMNLYFDFGVSMVIQVAHPLDLERPAITVCNINGFQMPRICREETCDYVEDEDNFCLCRPRYCEYGQVMENITFPSQSRLQELGLRSQEENVPYLQTNFSLFNFYGERRTLEGWNNVYPMNRKYMQSVRSYNSMGTTAICYSANTIVGRPKHKIQKILIEGQMYIRLRLHQEQYDPAIGQPFLQLAVHNPRTIVNPFVSGVGLFPGYDYTIKLNKELTVRLPAPYETRCVDYISLWKARGGRGPINERECMQECQKNASLLVRGCVQKGLDMPFNERVCSEGNNNFIPAYPGDNRNPDELVAKLTSECIDQHCRPACWEENFVLKVLKKEKGIRPNCWRSFRTRYKEINVGFTLNELELTTYSFKPQFESIEAFSYLGGYVGMWLGISLVAIFDFLEALVALLRYPFRRAVASARHRRPRDR